MLANIVVFYYLEFLVNSRTASTASLIFGLLLKQGNNSHRYLISVVYVFFTFMARKWYLCGTILIDLVYVYSLMKISESGVDKSIYFT